MRFFHVSEESNMDIFNPRIPERDDLDKSVGLVWAIDEKWQRIGMQQATQLITSNILCSHGGIVKQETDWSWNEN